jgi:hypothetical protein
VIIIFKLRPASFILAFNEYFRLELGARSIRLNEVMMLAGQGCGLLVPVRPDGGDDWRRSEAALMEWKHYFLVRGAVGKHTHTGCFFMFLPVIQRLSWCLRKFASHHRRQ